MSELSLEFDLYLFATWDGENTVWGKDYFSLSGDINESWTFTNHQPEGQSYPGTPDESYGLDIWNSNSVWVYRGLDPTGSGNAFMISHSGDSFSVTFGGPTNQTDEWWGIDNVRVSVFNNTAPVPEPSKLLLISSVLIAVIGFQVHRRKSWIGSLFCPSEL